MSFGLPYQKRFSSPGAVSSVSGAGNSGVFPCSGAMSVLDCHHLHERFTESAPACSCTTPSAKFPPGHTVPQDIASLCILIHLSLQHRRHCHSSLRGHMDLSLLVTICPEITFHWASPCRDSCHSSWVDSSHQCFGVQGFSLVQGVINTSIGEDWQQKTDMELPNKSIQGCRC